LCGAISSPSNRPQNLDGLGTVSHTRTDLLAALHGLLDEALELPPAERTAWLARLREARADMAAELETLLAAEAELDAQRFLSDGPLGARSGGTPGLKGQRLGAWTLDRPLGQGGTGTVWLARRSDGRFEGTAAVKLLNLALLGRISGERFRREGTLLARLDHPNIARLLDAGVTPAGQPYLVLEHLEGERLDRYCDARQLSPEARLRLFLDVLGAVAHAHANLIVHRDLKPSNILVTADRRVKLLDFGIAKMLEDESTAGEATALTDLGGRALTPEYAAPEQVSGGAMTTATDVYALGVLLYVLLAGRHPTGEGSRSAAEHLRGIVEREPPRLSSVLSEAAAAARGTTPERLRRLYMGDLDNIAAKTLKKNPAERYATVEALAEDIRRYLAHQPVSARPDTWRYRAGKFVRRHRAAVLAGGAAAGALLAASIVTTSQMLLAREQRREAERQRDAAVYQKRRADAQVEFQKLLVSQVGDEPVTMRQIVDRARAAVELQHAGDPRFLGALLVDLSDRYAELGDHRTRGQLLARAESLATRRQGGVPLAVVRCRMADNLREQGEYAAARAVLDGADSLLRLSPDRTAEIECLRIRATFAAEIREGQESARAAERALALKEGLGETDGVDYAELLGVYAAALDNVDRKREAVRVTDSAIRLLDRGGHGGQMARIILQHDKAIILVGLGELAQAERDFHESLRLAMASDPSGRVHPQPLIHYAETALAQARADSALKYFGLLHDQAVRDDNRYWRGRGLFGLARAQLRLGRIADARKSLVEFRRVAADFPRLQFTDDQLPDTTALEGHIALAVGDSVSAHRRFLAALRQNGYYDGKRKKQLRPVALLAAETAFALGRPDTAARYAREAAAIAAFDSLTEFRSARVGEARLVEGRAMLALGDSARAHEVLGRALRALRYGAGDDHPRTREAAELVTRLAGPPTE
jgi:serine/threonine protein kinase